MPEPEEVETEEPVAGRAEKVEEALELRVPLEVRGLAFWLPEKLLYIWHSGA